MWSLQMPARDRQRCSSAIAFRYAIKAGTLKEVREITWKASKKSEERLSQAVRNMREEAI